MSDAWQKLGVLAAGSGTLLSWFRSVDAGAVTTFVVATTGVSVWAYRQIAAARLEAEVTRIRELARARADAEVEAAERLAEFERRQNHADARIDHNASRLGRLKGELKDKGVIDDSDDPAPPPPG